MASRMSHSSANVVSTRTRLSGKRPVTAAHRLRPSQSLPADSLRSSSTTSGRALAIIAVAELTDAASPTTCRSDSLSSMARRPWRTIE
jgi:hypothetical protein